jgi:hypothetical protein
VAHCLRDIAHGDKSRSADLKKMVKSNDPAYRRLFEEAFWRDPESPPPKRPKKKRRRKS